LNLDINVSREIKEERREKKKTFAKRIENETKIKVGTN